MPENLWRHNSAREAAARTRDKNGFQVLCLACSFVIYAQLSVIIHAQAYINALIPAGGLLTASLLHLAANKCTL
jgi:hypothetical protein